MAKQVRKMQNAGGRRRPTKRQKREQRREVTVKLKGKVRREIPDSYTPATRAAVAVVPKKVRPVTEQDVEQVLISIAEGGTLRGTCTELGICEATVRLRLRDNPELSSRYVRARELQSEAWADDITEDVEGFLDYAADGSSVELQHRKLKFEAKRWLMGKNHVRRFGDKVVHEGGDRPVRHVHGKMTPREAMEAYAETAGEE